MYLRPELADRLVKLGVPDDSASLGNVVCELADMGLTLGNAYLPDLTDLVNVEVALHDRLAELAAINLHLLKLTVELGGAAEYRTLFYPFKQLAQRKERSQTP